MSRIEFDVVVVGAGPAGITASYILAKQGVKVALVERGEFPGSKNVMGGQIYCFPTAEIIPEFWKEAPIERAIFEKKVWLLTGDSKIELGYRNSRFAEPPYNAFTVLRAKFDRWFAQKARDAGAFVIPETLVTGVIKEGKKIAGVTTARDNGEIYAKVVVAADGVNSLLSKNAGLHEDIKPQQTALAVKEIIELPQEVIEDTFHLEKNQGLTIEIAGEFLKGMVGTGFIYTNKNSLSVGVGCLLSDWVESDVSPHELIEQMKAHPAIYPLLRKGQIREYMAHLIPEGGYNAIPPLYTDGMLVIGDAGMLVNGLHQEGSNFAMTSGKLAAETIMEAIKKNDYSAAALSLYKKKLNASYVIKDLNKYKKTMPFFEHNRHLLNKYPSLISDVAREMITVDNIPKKVKQSRIIKGAFAKRSIFGMIKDAISAWRAIQ